MFLFSFMRSMSVVLFAVALSGCAHFNSVYNRPTHNDPYARTGVDELLAFGASMANMPEPSRAELCKSLQNTQKISPSIGVQLHLMVGRLLSEACGDIPRLLDDINAINPAYVPDENLQRLISLHTQVLTRMHDHSKKAIVVEQKQPKVKSAPETKDARDPKKNETRLLREKLEAIRSMEKQLDETNGGN